MCGIVGVAGNGPTTPVMKDFFQSLLFHDVVRGHHATGVVGFDTLDRSITVVKKAVASPDFLPLAEVQDDLFHARHNFNGYIGHNRWATSGAKDDDANAHPFIHGDIVGVHNGSIRNQSLLDDHKKFIVDSDNVFYHLNKNGLTDTIAKTDGAFALVWFDRSNNSLNFIRNEERPLCIAKLTNGYWVWASERGMLTWLIARHKSLSIQTEDDLSNPGTKTRMIYDLEKGLHMAIKFKDKSRQMEDRLSITKMVLPTFGWSASDYYGTNYSSTRRDYRSQATQGRSTFQKERDAIIAKHLINGDSDAYLQVKFLGRVQPATTTGYVQDISTYEHRNVRGETILLHAYNHAGNMTRDWREDKAGTMLYCKIMNISRDQTPGHILNNANLDGNAQISVNEISANKPTKGSYFGYTAEGDEIRRDVSLSKDSGGSTSSVIPFPKSEGSQTSSANQLKLILANAKVGTTDLVSILTENSYRCANCAKHLRDYPLNKLHLINHFDREEGKTNPYLMCSKLCYDSMKEWTKDIDDEYNRILGVTNDNP